MNTCEKEGEGLLARRNLSRRVRDCQRSRLRPTASRTSGRATEAAHPSARSTAGNDPSSYERCGGRAIPIPRATKTRPCHPTRDANRIADSRPLSASVPPAREALLQETVRARCARASTQSTSRRALTASYDSPRSLSASFYFFARPSLLSSLPWRRGLYPKSPHWQAKPPCGRPQLAISLCLLFVSVANQLFRLSLPRLSVPHSSCQSSARYSAPANTFRASRLDTPD